MRERRQAIARLISVANKASEVMCETFAEETTVVW